VIIRKTGALPDDEIAGIDVSEMRMLVFDHILEKGDNLVVIYFDRDNVFSGLGPDKAR
jgi:hypothetical protein